LAEPAAPVFAVLTSFTTPLAGTRVSLTGAPTVAPGSLSTIAVPES